MTPLAHHLVSADDARRFIVVLHGILGSGRNWRSLARRVASSVPDVGAVLVDLRLHGDSVDAAPPHTIAAAADDVIALERSLRDGGKNVVGVIGHSFGGKVALAYRQRRRAVELAELGTTWIVDSSPSARPEVAAALAAGQLPGDVSAAIDAIGLLGDIGERFANRAAFVAAALRRGVSAAVAQWLALGLRRDGDGFALGRDLAGLTELLADYYAVDLWDEVEESAGAPLAFAAAGRGSALTTDDVDRLEQLELRGAVDLHRFADSGHWVHTDEPAALADAIAASLA